MGHTVDCGGLTGAIVTPSHPPVFSTDQRQALVALGIALRTRGYHFITVTPATHARVLARRVDPQAASLRDIFGWSRPFTEEAIDAELLALMHVAGVVEQQHDLLRSRVRMSTLAGEWLFHSAYPTSENDAVFFGPDTHRFIRTLQQAGAPAHAPLRVADLGCGSGAAAIVLARRYPQAEVTAVDINHRALALAGVNIELAALDNARCVYSNLLQQLEGEFDLIVANPPYLLDPAERAYRHGGGFLGSGLSLRIVREAVARLAPGGMLWLYTGVAMTNGEDPFRHQAADLLGHPGLRWTYEEVDPDVFGEELDTPAYAGAERLAVVWLCVCKDD